MLYDELLQDFLTSEEDQSMFSEKNVALIGRVIYWPRPESICVWFFVCVCCFSIQISLGRHTPAKHVFKCKTNVSFFHCVSVIKSGLQQPLYTSIMLHSLLRSSKTKVWKTNRCLLSLWFIFKSLTLQLQHMTMQWQVDWSWWTLFNSTLCCARVTYQHSKSFTFFHSSWIII